MISTSRLAIALSAWIGACSAPGRPPQSPANDTPPPVTNTGDGKLLGVAPDATQTPEGPKLDSKDGKEPPVPAK
jgi:hypothetical protein